MASSEEKLNGQGPIDESALDANPNSFSDEGGDLPMTEEEAAMEQAPAEKKYTFDQKTLDRINDLPKETLAKAGIHFDDYKDVDRRTGREFTRRGLITRAEQQGGQFAQAVRNLAYGEWTNVPVPVKPFADVLSREIPMTALVKLNVKSGLIADFRIQNPNIKKPIINEEVLLNNKMFYFSDNKEVMEVSDRDKLAMYYAGGVFRLPGSSSTFSLHDGDPTILVEKKPEAVAKYLTAKVDPKTEKINGVYYAKGEAHNFSFNISEAKSFASGESVFIDNDQGQKKVLRYNAYSGFFKPSITTKLAIEKAEKYLKERQEKKVGADQKQSKKKEEAPVVSKGHTM